LTAPTLIPVGDRDPFADGVRPYQALPAGELAVLPDTSRTIDSVAVSATIDFLNRPTAAWRLHIHRNVNTAC
jgi:hypothetical protein